MKKLINKKQMSRLLFFFFSFFFLFFYEVSALTISTSYYKASVCRDVLCASSSTINFLPSGGASPVTITGSLVTGYAWGDMLGWINFRPEGSGVTYDSVTGELSGYAWSEDSGWINFRPTGADGATSSLGLPIGVSINASNEWIGWAFASGRAGGWIKFDCSSNSTCVKVIVPPAPSGGSSAPSYFYGGGGGSGGGWNSPQPTSTQATSSNILSTSTLPTASTTGLLATGTISSSTTNVVKTPTKISNTVKKITTAVKEKVKEIISTPTSKKVESTTKLSSGGSVIGSGSVSPINSGKDPSNNIFTKEKEDVNKTSTSSNSNSDIDVNGGNSDISNEDSGSNINNSNGMTDNKNPVLSFLDIILGFIRRVISVFL